MPKQDNNQRPVSPAVHELLAATQRPVTFHPGGGPAPASASGGGMNPDIQAALSGALSSDSPNYFPTAGMDAARDLMMSGKLFGMDQYQDLGNGQRLATVGGVRANDPLQRMPAAMEMLGSLGLDPGIMSMFEGTSPISLMHAPAFFHEEVPGQQRHRQLQDVQDERVRLQRMTNAQLGLPKKANNKQRNEVIAGMLDEYGMSIGFGEGANAALDDPDNLNPRVRSKGGDSAGKARDNLLMNLAIGGPLGALV